MSENNQSTAIVITNDYPENKFNLLIPIKTIQELSPLHKPVINEVKVNPDPSGKDVYKEKNGELSLTKIALAKLMTAANIQVVESKPIPPQKCNRCSEIAARTKIAPKCYECPYVDDVAYQVTLAVPEPSGTWRKIIATKEIRMADAKQTMTDAQYKAFFPFRTEQCESKALNRALREALMIKSTYKAEELKKPFVVAYVVPNLADEDLKKAMVNKFAESSSMIFGNSNSIAVIEAPKNLDNEVVTILTDEEDENQDNIPVMDAEIVEEVPPITCEGCAQPIVALNEEWTVERIVDNGKKKYKKCLCADCQRKLQEQSKKAKEGAK